MGEVFELSGEECGASAFVIGDLLDSALRDTGRIMVVTVVNLSAGTVGESCRLAEDWHDLNEGAGVADLRVDLTGDAIALVHIIIRKE